ncbi:hypothetical protein W02_31640 [Nitrospira sp. KM1]|uniref:hypothetical protein n=1 Tax=Nitrospira sp. KM1 TaxID=1936990 RepID=UPI0013A726CD|nr:hypothetical protein [Nitrospira sp. KM1]BCA56024.1 hypothetical protein W02_31640 [Nitrospira sp. KM1]
MAHTVASTSSYQESGSILFIMDEPPLAQLLGIVVHDIVPDIQVEICHSQEDAMYSLERSSYLLAITSAECATTNDFRLLHQARNYQSSMPLIAAVPETERCDVWKMVHHGVFDLLPNPPSQLQVMKSIHRALSHNELLCNLASTHRAIEQIMQYEDTVRTRMNNGSHDAQRIMQELALRFEATKARLTESADRLSRHVEEIRTETQCRAVRTLSTRRI